MYPSRNAVEPFLNLTSERLNFLQKNSTPEFFEFFNTIGQEEPFGWMQKERSERATGPTLCGRSRAAVFNARSNSVELQENNIRIACYRTIETEDQLNMIDIQ
jgi:hypothetical protein